MAIGHIFTLNGGHYSLASSGDTGPLTAAHEGFRFAEALRFIDELVMLGAGWHVAEVSAVGMFRPWETEPRYQVVVAYCAPNDPALLMSCTVRSHEEFERWRAERFNDQRAFLRALP